MTHTQRSQIEPVTPERLKELRKIADRAGQLGNSGMHYIIIELADEVERLQKEIQDLKNYMDSMIVD